jgi:hypothetical protein
VAPPATPEQIIGMEGGRDEGATPTPEDFGESAKQLQIQVVGSDRVRAEFQIEDPVSMILPPAAIIAEGARAASPCLSGPVRCGMTSSPEQPSESGRRAMPRPTDIRMIDQNRVRVEFLLEDLVTRALLVQAPQVLGCLGCRGCEDIGIPK